MIEEQPSPDSPLFSPLAGQLCTRPLELYLGEFRRIFDFVFFGAGLAQQADEKRLHAARMRVKIAVELEEDDAKERSNLEQIEANKDVTFKRFISFNRLIIDNVISDLVNNFLCFPSEILQLCMITRPELLRSSETIKLEDILSFSSRDEMLEFIAEKKINDLSYGGVRELDQFFYNRLGFHIWESEKERVSITIAIELRNIITHNRGVVNRLFIGKFRGIDEGFKFELGARHKMKFREIQEFANNMAAIACRLDEQVAAKFDLERQPLTIDDS